MNKQISSQKIVVIFPAKNEEDTIEHVITTAKKSRYSPEVIVVDAYSSDATVEKATKIGARVIQQDDRLFPAKGIAMKKGLNEAIRINADVILFLDADIKNLTPEWIDKLVEGCANCDMARGYYQRHTRDAAVTKLIAKNPPDGWGIDIWFLIEAAMSGYQIKEIFLGQKEHTSFEDYREDVGKLANMAEQVEFTIIKEASRHDRINLHQDVKI